MVFACSYVYCNVVYLRVSLNRQKYRRELKEHTFTLIIAYGVKETSAKCTILFL